MVVPRREHWWRGYRASACLTDWRHRGGKPDAQTLENYLIEAAGLWVSSTPKASEKRSRSSMVTSPMTARSRRWSGRESLRRSSRTLQSRPWSSPSSRTITRSGSGLIRSQLLQEDHDFKVRQNPKPEKSKASSKGLQFAIPDVLLTPSTVILHGTHGR